MGSGGLPSLQNWCDPTTSGWVGSIPTRSRHPRPFPPRDFLIPSQLSRGTRLLAPAIAALFICGSVSSAQRRDTVPPAVVVETPAVPVSDTIPRPPLTPRRAFLYSLAVPGSAQTILGRPRTAAIFITVEALAITLARKSANDLREAKRFARDSIVAEYQIDASTGLAVLDSTGRPVPSGYLPNRFAGDRVAARRTHLEDWIATLVFNHLLSGAEAFVSAQLWDLPAQVSMQSTTRGTFLTARIPW